MTQALIVKTGSALPELKAARGDYEDWIAEGLGLAGVDVWDAVADDPPSLTGVRGVVVTGSSALVTDREPWSVRATDWLREAVGAGLPTLGICYGHQLLADALGGKVGTNAKGREMGTIEVKALPEAKEDRLFGPLPRRWTMQSSHRQSVIELPAGATRLASNAHDPNQAVCFGPSAWGVQFHPEWDDDVIRAYLQSRVKVLEEEGLDAAGLIASVEPSPLGPVLLARFGALIR